MNNITYEFVDEAELMRFYQAVEHTIYQGEFTLSVSGLLNEEEREMRVQNAARMDALARYFLLAKVDGAPVGYSFGIQRNADDFYMRNSGVLPEFRRLGIYTGMLEKAVEWIVGLGFQRIDSYHKLSNSPILMAKLKFGFVLSGFKVSEKNGCMAILTYYVKEERKALYEVRAGSRVP